MFTIAEICQCTQGILLSGAKDRVVPGVSTDTRTIRKGDLFVALQGKKFDGHKFIQVALGKKAGALLVSRKISLRDIRIPVIFVQDTLQAYCALARYHRERFSIPVIALTGSAGKTTTKELIAQVLSKRFHVLKNVSTENNEIGVAKTLLQLKKTHEIAILEFGTNHFGEIQRLTRMGQPTIALLMNIGDSHLEFFKDRRGVFKEKTDIFRYSEHLRSIIYNCDDKWLQKIRTPGRKITLTAFSIKRKSRFQARNIRFDSTLLSFSAGRERFTLKTLLADNVYNALAAIVLGKRFHVARAEIQKSLRTAIFPKGRQGILKVQGRWVIDDTYNANPTSTAAALNALQSFSVHGKKIFVFGDMRELGSVSRRAHIEIGRLTAACGVDLVLTYGRWSKLTSEQTRKKGIPGCHCATQDALVRHLAKQTLPGDVILIKGSRGMQMERILEKLKACHF